MKTTTMRTMTASEANRQFSKVLREVAQGEVITVTSRGRAVATIIPNSKNTKERNAARRSLLARLERREPSGARDWTRAELYTR